MVTDTLLLLRIDLCLCHHDHYLDFAVKSGGGGKSQEE